MSMSMSISISISISIYLYIYMYTYCTINPKALSQLLMPGWTWSIRDSAYSDSRDLQARLSGSADLGPLGFRVS